MSRVRPLLFVSVAVVLMAGAACGSSSSSGASSSAANAGLGVTTTTPPSTTQSSGSVGGGGSSFCATGKADVASLKAKLAALATSGTDPQAFKAKMLTIQHAYQQAESQAPGEIKPDLAAVNAFITKLDNILAAHGWNPLAAGTAAVPLLQNNGLQGHMNHLQAWAKANCS
jgi:hypothetical protein